MQRILASLLLASIALTTGCASIVKGTDQKLTFDSEPDGATVSVSGRVLGKTPLTASVDRASNQAFTFEKDGYETHTSQLSTTTNPWFFGNIVLGGLIGSTVDGVSGAIHQYSPDQYFITLTAESPAERISSSDPRRIKELVFAFSGKLRKQLAGGEGEIVDTLLSLIDAEDGEGDKQTTIRALNKLALNNSDDLEFAEKIIAFYGVD